MSVFFELFSHEPLEVEQLSMTKQKTVVISSNLFPLTEEKVGWCASTLKEEEEGAIPPVYCWTQKL